MEQMRLNNNVLQYEVDLLRGKTPTNPVTGHK